MSASFFMKLPVLLFSLPIINTYASEKINNECIVTHEYNIILYYTLKYTKASCTYTLVLLTVILSFLVSDSL